MLHQDADGDDDNAADDDDEVIESEDESEANSSHVGSLIEDDDELAEMRALVREQGPITRRMAKNSL
jgi:hypothetical protein